MKAWLTANCEGVAVGCKMSTRVISNENGLTATTVTTGASLVSLRLPFGSLASGYVHVHIDTRTHVLLFRCVHDRHDVVLGYSDLEGTPETS